MTHFLLFDFDGYCQYYAVGHAVLPRHIDNLSHAHNIICYITLITLYFRPTVAIRGGITRGGFFDKHALTHCHTLTIFACPTRHRELDTPTHRHI